MTFYDVLEQLSVIVQAASSLLQETGFDSDDGPGDCVCPLADAAQDAFLRDRAEQLLESLEMCSLKLNQSDSKIINSPFIEYHSFRFPSMPFVYLSGLYHS